MASLDVIVPFFNEAESAPAFARLLKQLAQQCRDRFNLAVHLILIDDGSTDDSATLFAAQLSGSWEIVRLSRNFGKEAAVLAGLDRVAGDYVLIMDADLQHSQEIALRLLTELLTDEQVDVVYARTDRRNAGWRRSQLARLFYGALNSSQRVEIPANAGDFRCMRASVAHALAAIRDKRRFNKGLYAWAGFRQKAITYTPEPRHGGTSKWNWLALLALSFAAFTSFSVLPLRVMTLIGALVALGGGVYGVTILFEVWFYGISVPGYPSLVIAVVLLGGLNLALLGMIGEYVWVAVSESKDRPVYIVRDRMTHQASKQPASRLETTYS